MSIWVPIRIKGSKFQIQAQLISRPDETRLQRWTNAHSKLSITCLKSDYMIFFKDNIFWAGRKHWGPFIRRRSQVNKSLSALSAKFIHVKVNFGWKISSNWYFIVYACRWFKTIKSFMLEPLSSKKFMVEFVTDETVLSKSTSDQLNFWVVKSCKDSKEFAKRTPKEYLKGTFNVYLFIFP